MMTETKPKVLRSQIKSLMENEKRLKRLREIRKGVAKDSLCTIIIPLVRGEEFDCSEKSWRRRKSPESPETEMIKKYTLLLLDELIRTIEADIPFEVVDDLGISFNVDDDSEELEDDDDEDEEDFSDDENDDDDDDEDEDDDEEDEDEDEEGL